MSFLPFNSTLNARSSEYRVRAPHANDALALSLQCAFAESPTLPDELMALLEELNRVPRGHVRDQSSEH